MVGGSSSWPTMNMLGSSARALGFQKKTGVYPNSSLLQLKKIFWCLYTKSSSTGSEMISFLFLSPQIQDGDHYVKRPPPHHVHAIIIMLLKLFFQSHEI